MLCIRDFPIPLPPGIRSEGGERRGPKHPGAGPGGEKPSPGQMQDQMSQPLSPEPLGTGLLPPPSLCRDVSGLSLPRSSQGHRWLREG